MQNTASGSAERYPSKPITVIVPFSAGGGLDVMARTMEKFSVKHLGQPLIIVNKTGGAGAVGWNELSGAKADGYVLGTSAIDMILQPLYGQNKYDYPTALEPLAQITILPMAVVISPSSPWHTIEEMVAYAKQNPGKVKYGHSGLGSVSHVAGEMLAQEAGINMQQVPFNGGADSMTALLGGHIDAAFVASSIAKEHVKSGKLRALAVIGTKRSDEPEFRSVPTLKEQQLNVAIDVWYGIAVPKGLPTDVKKRLAEGIRGIASDPEFQKNMEALGSRVEYLGPQEAAEVWRTDTEKLAKAVRDTGIAERIAAQKH